MYALLNIPAHTNCKNCGDCCGVIPANTAEMLAIREYLKDHPEAQRLAIAQSNWLEQCPFRDTGAKKCAIYPVRPLICRLYGVTGGIMQCPHGNTATIDGYRFLTGHSMEDIQVLNQTDWRNE